MKDKTYSNDCSKFNPELFLHDEVDVEGTLEVIRSNFDILNSAFIHGLLNSKEFPEISSTSFIDMMNDAQETFAESEQIQRAWLENAFIRATRGDGESGLRGQLCRGEFFDCIVRIVAAIYPKQKISDKIEPFVKKYFGPIHENSQQIKQRILI